MEDESNGRGSTRAEVDLERCTTRLGHEAVFRDADTEVARVLGLRKNYYAILKVNKGSDPDTVRENHRRLVQAIGAANVRDGRVESALEASEKACKVLSHPTKKLLYDRYALKVDVDAVESESYDEWMDRNEEDGVVVPGWLETLLGFRGISLIVVVVIAILLLPLFLLVAIFTALFCIPFELCGRCLCPQRSKEAKERAMRQFGREQEREEHRCTNCPV